MRALLKRLNSARILALRILTSFKRVHRFCIFLKVHSKVQRLIVTVTYDVL